MALVLEVLPQSHILEQPPGGGRKRLPDAGYELHPVIHLGPIDQKRLMKRGEQEGGGRPGWPGPNHHHIGR